MAVLALTDCALYVAGYDFTSDTNSLLLNMEAEAKDKTTFGSQGWTELAGGRKSAALAYKGFWQSATDQAVDPQAFPALGVADQPVSVLPVEAIGGANPQSGYEPPYAYILRAAKMKYMLGGQHGELAPFTLDAVNSNGQGVIKAMNTRPRAAVSATGALGVTYDTFLGGPLGVAFSRVYVPVHIFTAGATVTIQLQSDDNSGFSSPTTVTTIGPLTASGGTWASVAGPFTDRYFRLNVSAITGSFDMAAFIGFT